MAVTLLVVAGCIYAVGLRADRIHAGRTVVGPKTTETVSTASGGQARGVGVFGTTTVTYRGKTARQWALKYKRRTTQYQKARRVLLMSPTVSEAINLAAAVYGNGATLWRRARCESGLDPLAHNPSDASGLFQFLGSTWSSTPFGRFSIWSPYANALAAGWMIGPAGRGGEWSCR